MTILFAIAGIILLFAAISAIIGVATSDSGPGGLPMASTIPLPVLSGPSEPPKEPSCFAKGIAESIKTEPDNWQSQPYGTITSDLKLLFVKHVKTSTTIYARRKWVSQSRRSGSDYHVTANLKGCHEIGAVAVSGSHLSDEDAALIGYTLETNLIGQMKEAADKVAAKEARIAKAQSYFITLGCPPAPPTPPPPVSGDQYAFR